MTVAGGMNGKQKTQMGKIKQLEKDDYKTTFIVLKGIIYKKLQYKR